MEALSPSGGVTLPFSFEWRTSGPDAASPAAPAPDTVYRVSLYDPAERLLHAWDTRATHAEPPPDLARYFRSGESFLWRVAVLDGEGKPAVESPLTRFTIE